MTRAGASPLRRLLLAIVVAASVAIWLSPATSQAATPNWWGLASAPAPTNLTPGSEGKIVVTASNLGYGVLSGETEALVITDKLPEGIEATAVTGNLGSATSEVLTCHPSTFPAKEVSCEDHTSNPKYRLAALMGLKIAISVKVKSTTAPGTLKNEVIATGGGAPSRTVKEPITISSTPAPFGVQKYEIRPEGEGGALEPQGGSHPFQLTTVVAFNQTATEEPVQLPRNLSFNLPPGLLGNPQAAPKCSIVDFDTVIEGPANLCPPQTAIGLAEVIVDEPLTFGRGPGVVTVPVFNLEPAPGEPARFGIQPLKVPVLLDTAIRTGSDYGVVVSAKETAQTAGLVASRLTFWGVPGDKRHNIARGWECAAQGQWAITLNTLGKTCPKFLEKREKEEADEKAKGEEPKPFLQMPTSCESPLRSPMTAQSWTPGAPTVGPVETELEQEPGHPMSFTGCASIPFSPGFAEAGGVKPDVETASTPTGMTVKIHVPQKETPGGLTESAIRSTTVTLPEGLQLNAAAANGLAACSALQFGFTGASEEQQTENNLFSTGSPACPDAAKVGTVSIKTPDLTEELVGSVYLAAEHTNPFKAPLVLYLVAEGKETHVLVKLAGKVTPTEGTGQIVSTFENTPQVPFEDLNLHFFNGPRASLATPTLCGAYQAGASFVPWSGNPQAASSAGFNITSGPGGGPCATNPPSFAPSSFAESTNTQAGGFTNFGLTVQRPDGQQQLTNVSVTLPQGVAALLSKVTPCPEPPVGQEWSCGPASQIGHATASSGLGPEPVTLGGTAYLTTGYDGAPFGLLVVTPAVAGPFNLGNVPVRSRINVDPTTAAVTVTTDGGPHHDVLPTMLKGVPVQVKQLHVTVDRPEFQFNPTSCNPMAITGTLGGDAGATAPLSTSFQVSGCNALPFAPKLTASTSGTASKVNGTNLDVKLVSAGLGQANIAKVFLQLPAALPSRLSTIQKACLSTVFNVNPASCPEGSLIGQATIHTPVLKSPLSGPAYLVAHGAQFPDVEFVLQGEGILLILDGKTDIKNGITYSRFEAAPDAPFTTFDTTLPAGPHSALTAYTPATPYNVCKTKLDMPTEITGQNGAVIKQTTSIVVQGCGEVARFRETKLQACEKQARKKYAKKRKKRNAAIKACKKKYGPKKKHAKGKAKKKK